MVATHFITSLTVTGAPSENLLGGGQNIVPD